jgi:hypothetical protein
MSRMECEVWSGEIRIERCFSYAFEVECSVVRNSVCV